MTDNTNKSPSLTIHQLENIIKYIKLLVSGFNLSPLFIYLNSLFNDTHTSGASYTSFTGITSNRILGYEREKRRCEVTDMEN